MLLPACLIRLKTVCTWSDTDIDILDVDLTTYSEDIFKYFFHGPLKRGQGVFKTERHGYEFEAT